MRRQGVRTGKVRLGSRAAPLLPQPLCQCKFGAGFLMLCSRQGLQRARAFG